MQGRVVEDLFQKGALKFAAVDIDVPVFGEKKALIEIVVGDMERGAVEREVGKAIEADIDVFFVGRVAAIVPGKPAAVGNVGKLAALDGHATGHDLGWILFAFAIFNAYMLLMATQVNLAVFAVFSILWLKEPFTLNHGVGFALIALGAFFVFKGPFH